MITLARCVCNNPCTCYFEYDGDRPNTNYTQPYQYGRYSTRRTGSGTTNDPYVIEFLDSEEFQVEAGQIRPNQDLVLTSGLTTAVIGYTQIDYETPHEIFLAVDIHVTDPYVFPSRHKFWLVSAQADFIYNGSTSGTKRLYIQWHPPADNYGSLFEIVVAGTSTTQGIAEDITLSCSGLMTFVDVVEKPFFYGQGGNIRVTVQQTSGSNATVRNVRLTLVAI